MKNKSEKTDKKIEVKVLKDAPKKAGRCAHTFHNIGTRDKPKYKCGLCGKLMK